jgi:hypothetical protein
MLLCKGIHLKKKSVYSTLPKYKYYNKDGSQKFIAAVKNAVSKLLN